MSYFGEDPSDLYERRLRRCEQDWEARYVPADFVEPPSPFSVTEDDLKTALISKPYEEFKQLLDTLIKERPAYYFGEDTFADYLFSDTAILADRPRCLQLLQKDPVGCHINDEIFAEVDEQCLQYKGRISLETVKIIFKHFDQPCMKDWDCEVDIQSYKNGRTILMLAAKWNDPDMVTYLLERNADPTLKDKEGRSVFHYAAQNDCLIPLAEFRKMTDQSGPGETESEPLGCTLLEEMVRNKRDFLDARDKNGFTAVMYAEKCGKQENLKYLLKHGLCLLEG